MLDWGFIVLGIIGVCGWLFYWLTDKINYNLTKKIERYEQKYGKLQGENTLSESEVSNDKGSNKRLDNNDDVVR